MAIGTVRSPLERQNRATGGERTIGSTSSGGRVNLRSFSDVQSSSQNISSGSSNKTKSRNRRKAPAVIDIRPNKNNQKGLQGSAEGDVFAVVQEIESKDTDDTSTSAENYLARLNQTISTVRENAGVKSPVSFSQERTTQLSSGARRIDDPSLSGTGFGASARGGGSAGGASSVARTSGVLGLPTPDNLQEAMRLSYESKNSGMSAFLQQAVSSALMAGFRAMSPDNDDEQRRGIFEEIGQNINRFTTSIRETYSQPQNLNNVLQALGNQAGVGTGFNVAFNNTMVQQFSGVAPRSFTFNWKLYAEDPGQSANIMKTIQLLRLASHPELIDPLLNIIRYPAIIKRFDIRSPNGLILFPIFPSVITDIVVDYSASGAPFFFKNGMPASVSLTISITEITSRTRNDFRGDSGGGGGGGSGDPGGPGQLAPGGFDAAGGGG